MKCNSRCARGTKDISEWNVILCAQKYKNIEWNVILVVPQKLTEQENEM